MTGDNEQPMVEAGPAIREESMEKGDDDTSPDELSGTHTWKLEHVTRRGNAKIYSDTFEIGGINWRILCFPCGNHCDDVSLYLDCADVKNFRGERRPAEFTLTLVNKEERQNYSREATHHFSEKEADWGFTNFFKLTPARNPDEGYLVDDTWTIEVKVRVFKGDEHYKQYLSTHPNYAAYDSKKATGFVGLKNQGATCYMNSLLQTLFHVNHFRESVYKLPTDQEQSTKSIPLALQRVFYKLQTSDSAVGTKELTKSFGWDTYDSFTQHDVQELNRVLCDNIEEKMKGTPVEGTVEKLFQGKLLNFIKCINVDFKSTRTENFYDISLNVKGCKDIVESFRNYVEVERLDGDNKYQAEGHGLQDAEKGCSFESFPPVLSLHLKRFEYDPMRDAMVKVNDRFEFPDRVDLTEFLTDKGQSSQTYRLLSVLVHAGDLNAGHYYAFIRPEATGKWYKFDDDRVTIAEDKAAIEDNFGGGYNEDPADKYGPTYNNRRTVTHYKKSSNAYMLVYVRESDDPKIMNPVKDTDVPTHLVERFRKEQEEENQKKKEKNEAHLYMQVKVCTEEDLCQHRGNDLIDFSKIEPLKLLKTSTCGELKQELQNKFNIPVESQRLWTWVSRQNKTLRPDFPINQPDTTALADLRAGGSNINLLLERVDPREPTPSANDFFLFFKWYKPDDGAGQAAELAYFASTVVPSNSTVQQVLPFVYKRLDIPESQQVMAFEEVRPTMIEPLKYDQTLKDAELENGDIIVFQNAPPPTAATFPEAPNYYTYLRHRVIVKFKPLDKPKEEPFELELAKDMSYDLVAQRVGEKLNTDPMKIRFYPHNPYTDAARAQPLKRNLGSEQALLSEMLEVHSTDTDLLYYEMLDHSIIDLENKKTLKVVWRNSKVETVETHSLLLPKEGTFTDAEEALRPLIKLDPTTGTGQIRFLEVLHSRIHSVISSDTDIARFNHYSPVHAEEIRKDDAYESPDRVSVVHFTRNPIVSCHGNPFWITVERNDTFGAVIEKIQSRLQIDNAVYAKWKHCVISSTSLSSQIKEITDKEKDVKFWDKFDSATESFGLEHPDTTPRQTYTRSFDKPIKLYN